MKQQPTGQLQGPQNEYEHNTFWSCDDGISSSSSILTLGKIIPFHMGRQDIRHVRLIQWAE